jgi:hypothetical protein
MAVSPLATGLSRNSAAQELLAAGAAPIAPAGSRLEPTAGRWETWLVPSVSGLRPPLPPAANSARTRAEIQELLTLQRQRSAATRAIVQFWDSQGGVPIWSQILLDKINQDGVNPVLASRAIALLHTAMADATNCAWNAKFLFRRTSPPMLDRRITSISQVTPSLPSYPSEHAAVGAAASAVLNYLFPSETVLIHGQKMTFDAAANEAAASRLWAGANYRSDVQVGLLLGQAIGFLAIDRGRVDGYTSDNEQGLISGHSVAGLAIDRARRDGSPPP